MFVEDATITSSEQDSLRKQLLQAQRLSSVGAVASSVAHELNNILTVIFNNAKLALRGRATDQDRIDALEKILRSGERAGNIVKSMLGVAREGSDSLARMDLVALVEEILLLTEKDLLKHRVRVEKDFHDRPEAMGNPSQIEQVLINLILNARQSMPSGGMLRLKVCNNLEEGMAEIRVADNGCGIPPEKLRLIFDPFFTTKDPDEEGHGGTGLGLSVCRQIIESHHGRIRVESLEGRGATFILKLPLLNHDLD